MPETPALDRRSNEQIQGRCPPTSCGPCVRRPAPTTSEPLQAGAGMELESLNVTFVIDTFLLLLIGIGPKIALVPFLEATRQMPQATQRRVLRKMLSTAAAVAVLL